MPIDDGGTPATLRDAREADLPAILEIYNDAILTTTAVWSDDVVSLESRVAWLGERQRAGYPVFVAEQQGEVVGFGSYGPFRPWAGYRHTVEHSVYVSRLHRRAGAGRRLVGALVEHASLSGHHVLVGGIEAENTASLALHASLGFEVVGRLRQVGAKHGRWLDLIFMQLRLDGRPTP